MTAITVDKQNLFYSSTNGVLFDETQTTLVKYPNGFDGNYTIPSSVASIGGDAFADCILNSITIPINITRIADNTFYGCTSLTNIAIPDSITSIGYESFGGCTSLHNITIPDSVTTSVRAFTSCTSLTNVTIGTNVTSIGQLRLRTART